MSRPTSYTYLPYLPSSEAKVFRYYCYARTRHTHPSHPTAKKNARQQTRVMSFVLPGREGERERIAVAGEVEGKKEAATTGAGEGSDIPGRAEVRFDAGAAYGVLLGTSPEKPTQSRAQRDDGKEKSAAATGAADSASAVADAPCEETAQTALTVEDGGDAFADGGADEDRSLEAVRRRLRESMGMKRGAQDEL